MTSVVQGRADVASALTRYRVIAYVVGVILLVLVLVAMPAKYGWDNPRLVEVIGPIHGWMYMVYLVLSFLLARKVGWPTGRTILVLLAGTVPFLSFVVERRVTRELTTPVPPPLP